MYDVDYHPRADGGRGPSSALHLFTGARRVLQEKGREKTITLCCACTAAAASNMHQSAALMPNEQDNTISRVRHSTVHSSTVVTSLCAAEKVQPWMETALFCVWTTHQKSRKRRRQEREEDAYAQLKAPLTQIQPTAWLQCVLVVLGSAPPAHQS